MRHAATIAFAASVAALVVVSTLLTTQVGGGSIEAVRSKTLELQRMVVYEQEVTTPDGDIVIVRTHAGEAPDEASLWALHQSRVDRVKAG